MTNSGGLDVHADGDDVCAGGDDDGAVANFTYPGTTGASCTVTYSVCAPAPNTTDTAALTVTGSRAGADGNEERDVGGGGGWHGQA